jgi:Ni2+-binding GTPase involved in maturation of urease and hydrogenase
VKLVMFAGTATVGKTSVIRHAIRKCLASGARVAFFKLDVQFAAEDEELAAEFGIPTKKAYSGELCPDHCSVLVLGEAVQWARETGCDVFFVETAGLCLRCSPYVDGGLGVVVLEATSGMNLPRKIGPMLSLADVAVVTKIDLVSQAEREVFRAGIHNAAPMVLIREVNALKGIGIDPLVQRINATAEVGDHLLLRGSPPIGTCTICAGSKDIGWEHHFGVVRPLNGALVNMGQ